MTTQLQRQYLTQLEQALAATSLSEKERREILLELENHFSEARVSGASADDVVNRFGSANALANAYAAELMPGPTRLRRMPWLRWLLRLSTIFAGGVITLLLGVTGVAMITVGVLALAYGVVGPFLPPAWADLVLRFGLPQLVFILSGGLVAVVGIVTVRVLLFNLSLLSKTAFGSLETEQPKGQRI